MQSTMTFSFDSKPVQTIVNEIKNKGRQGSIDLQPSYQRGYVWNDDFKDKLIYSVIRQYPIGNISLRTNDGIKEVVDGQQRLTTIYNFIYDSSLNINVPYEVRGEYAKKIVNYIVEYLGENYEDPDLRKLKKRLDNKTGIKIRYNQLPKIIKDNINAYNISITNIMNANDEEIREFFRFLQNQERLKAGEIINSFPETELETYLDKILDLDLFLNKISFSNDRRDFDKHFYSIIGLINKSINYGVTDKMVINFALNINSDELEDNILIENLVSNINLIIKNNSIKEKGLKNSNVRFIKYLMLLCAFNLVDFSIDGDKKMNRLDELNGQFSAFNSAKTEEVEKTFKGYKTEVIDEFRLITLLSKGSHPFNRAQNRIEILAHYINNYDKKFDINSSGLKAINK